MLWLSSVPILLVFGTVAFGALRSCASMDRRRCRLRLARAFLFFGGGLTFLVFWFVAVAIGGDAVNGRVSDGRHYVASHGKSIEVSETLYRYSYAYTVSTFITQPLALLGGISSIRPSRRGRVGTTR
jgi:hypothetical protein